MIQALKKPCRVFLVDDHPVVLNGIRAILEGESGIDVVGSTCDAESAMTALVAANPDIAVIDISLPGASGVHLLEWLKAEHSDVKTLILTVREETCCVHQLLDAGADGYLAKRCVAEHLFQAICSIMGGGQYVDPDIAGKLLLARKPVNGKNGVLSERELSVAQCVARGLSNKETSRQLNVSVKTIETYRARANTKLGVRNRAELVRLAVDRGWLDN